jgi:hypothetical protein
LDESEVSESSEGENEVDDAENKAADTEEKQEVVT